MPMAKLSRRHHYLPQFYLRGFADQFVGFWIFDREEKAYRRQTPLNVCVEKDFYEVKGPAGERSDAVEKMLAQIEGTCKPVIERLDERIIEWKGEERETFALLAALMRTRVPAFDQEQNDFVEKFFRWWTKVQQPTIEAVREGIKEFEGATGQSMDGVSPEQIFEMVRDDKYIIENPRQNNIKMMLDLALDLAPVLFAMDWMILSAPKRASFITCDNPFTVVPPPDHDHTLMEYGIATPGASTILPLSSKTAIVFRGNEGHVTGGQVGHDFIRRINCLVAVNSDRFVIARDRPLLEKTVKRTSSDKFRRTFEIQFNEPDPYVSNT